MGALRWSIDSLTVKDGTIFGFGWIFHESKAIRSLGFQSRDGNRDDMPPLFVRADFGKPRPDVQAAFPADANALNSGFAVLGDISDLDQASATVACEVVLEDGEITTFSVSPVWATRESGNSEKAPSEAVKRQLLGGLKRGVSLVRAGQYSVLFEKIGHYAKGRPKSALKAPSDLARLLGRKLGRGVVLVVDHDLGGGANQYRERMVDEIVSGGQTTLILTFHVVTLTHMLIVRGPDIDTRVSLPGREFLMAALRPLLVSKIIYNTGVSFPKPEQIPDLLLSLKMQTGAQLEILGHDYFSVCPSHFLLDYEGAYCGVPDISQCTRCLVKNQQGFTALFSRRDIGLWRRQWGLLLATADNIVVFSGDTLRLLMRAYPQLDSLRISVVPHQVEHWDGVIPKIENVKSLHIGVVGRIGPHKGAEFVKDLAAEIARRKLSIKITIVGEVEARCDPVVVHQTGVFRRQDLPGIIEKSGINIILFPSICPETFSFVVQELMEMQLPVASFSLGAPAERLATYEKGRVLTSMKPTEVLDELFDFHRNIYKSE